MGHCFLLQSGQVSLRDELISCVQSESGPSSRKGAKADKQDCGGGGIPLTHCIIILMENNQDEKPQSPEDFIPGDRVQGHCCPVGLEGTA